MFIGLLFHACQPTIDGNGVVISKSHEVSKFTRLEVSGEFGVSLTQSEVFSLEVEADENLHEIIEIKEKGEALEVSLKQNVGQSEKLQLNINVANLESIDLSGAVHLWTEGNLFVSELEMDCSGAAEIDLEIVSNKLTMDMSGASEVILNGKVSEVSSEISGAGKIMAYGLESKAFTIDISGAGEAEVNVSEKLTVDVAGAGSVRYKGTPKVNKSISGAGSVEPANEEVPEIL